MWEKVNQSSFLKSVIFCVTCLFVYGGAVNFGPTDLFPALPFIFLLGYLTFKWRGAYLLLSLLFVLSCGYFYKLKRDRHSLFFPAISRELVITQDICLVSFEYTPYSGKRPGEVYVLKDDFALKEGCKSSTNVSSKKFLILNKGTKLHVEAVEVSNADFGELYYIKTMTPIGRYHLRDFASASWIDGSKIVASDLRRNIFYVPSLLMYWPVFPITMYFVLRDTL